MSASFIILELAGQVVILLWGIRMVQNGIERAFGSDLRRILGRALRNRLVAVVAGACVTMLLQSSTATAMLVTSFAARGAVELIPALAVMLGANVGTALIVKALSFDVSWLAPLLLLTGHLSFKLSPKGRYRDLGRVGVGLGLTLVALHMLVETFRPVETAPVLGNILAALTADPILDMLLAAALTFAAHSSVAVVLLLAGLSAGGVVTPAAAIALVLGANLGGALPPVLETRSASPSNRRVPIGNLLFRAIGCAIVLPFAQPVAEALWRYDPDPRSATTTFHLVFNAALAIACLGLLGPAGALLTRLFPEKPKPEAEVAQPLFLDPEALETPYLALSNAAREILRMGDLVDALLRLVPIGPVPLDKKVSEQAAKLGRELDRLHEAVKGYLAKLDRTDLTERDLTRLSDLVEFAVNLGHAGDILERDVIRASTRQGDGIGEADRDVVSRVRARVVADLRLALSTMMTEDERSARELLDAKREINEFERATARDHLARLGGADPATLAASNLFLSLLRDLKRVNSHLATIGYAVMSSAGPSRSDRLASPPEEDG
jgi:phosphate:Na+ symporter